MILTIFEGKTCTSMTLPDCAEGRHLILRPSDDEPLLMAVGTPEGWSLVEMGARLLDAAQTRLESRMLIKTLCRKDQQMVMIYAEAKTKNRQQYGYMLMPGPITLKVGADAGCDIIYDDPHVARHHLTLRYDGKAWSATVEKGAGHIYVNGSLFEGGALRMGDMLFLMGMRMVFLPGILCCNCPDGRVKPNRRDIGQVEVPEIDQRDYYRQAPERTYFNRMPRFVKTMEEEKLSVDAPPAQQDMQQQSALLQMGPALTSGLFAMLGGMASMMSVGMMASNLIFPSIGRKKMMERQEAYEKRRREAYRAYLDQLEAQLADMAQRQLQQLQKQLPPAVETAKRLLRDRRHLWDRRRAQKDSMQLRLGEGSWPLKCDITLPPQHFDLTDDPVRAMVDEMRQKKRMLHHAPIGMDLKKYSRIGMAGSGEDLQRLMWQLLVQLTTQLGYDELKLCLMGALPRALRPFARLPHTWSDDGRHHFLAQSETEMNEISQVLEGMLALRRSDMPEEEIDRLPRLVVLITETELSQRGVLHRQLLEKKYPGVHVICLGRTTSDLPRQSELVVGVKDGRGELISSEGERFSFAMDGVDTELSRPLVSMMENTLLDMPDTDSRLPDVVPFLQLFGVTQVEELNLMSRYFRNDPARTLAVPIGVDASGETCWLDMHEKAQCFNGLIAGTIGSGKSELIMTIILSLACCFSPEQVNFALIDFKGGSTAQAFQRLPHTVGVLTNLEGGNVNRALKSIKSELVRRQALFDRIKQVKNKTKIDINDYQRMYSAGEVKEPLPHLFIIVDEFAELKSQQPDFMDELVSTARIGRELGVHVLLATQKPAGVINDQIESNVGLRICLRVQSNQDSQDVLKCPDAAMLTGVGRFYMHTGNSHGLTLAQSAYTGAPYMNVVEAMSQCVVEVVDRTGYVLRTKNIDNDKPRNAKTQLAAVVDYICDTAQRARFVTRPLWQPPLETQELAVLQRQYPSQAEPWELAALIGEADDPDNQRRVPVRLSLNTGRSTMIYGALGSGKTMTLMAMMQDLLASHTPQELHAYVLDYMNEGLGVKKAAPHVGDVIGEMEDEKLQRLLAMLEKEVERRKQLMGGLLLAGGVPQRLRQAGLCTVLVVIHGMPALQNKLANDMTRLVQLLSVGPQYGVCFVGTMPTASGLSFQLSPHFTQKVVLQMPSDDDYGMLLGSVGRRRPGEMRGRGFIHMGEKLYEFQTAKCRDDVGAFCQSLADAWQGEVAKPIGLMPKRVDAALLAQSLDRSQPMLLPIGLDGDNVEPVMLSLDKKAVHQVIGANDDVAAFAQSLAMLSAMQGVEPVILDAAGQLGAVPGARVLAGNEIVDFVDELFQWAVDMKNGLAVPERRRMVLVTDAFALMNRLREINKEINGMEVTSWDLLSSLLAKVNPQWLLSFVVCASEGGMSALNMQGWYTAQLNQDNGLWLGSGLGSYSSALKAKSDVTPGQQAFPWGYVVTNGKAQRVRFAAEEVEQG